MTVEQPALRQKSPIKPYKNDFNYFPGYKPTNLPIPKPKPVVADPPPQPVSQPEMLYYQPQVIVPVQPPEKEMVPKIDSMFDEYYAPRRSTDKLTEGN